MEALEGLTPLTGGDDFGLDPTAEDSPEKQAAVRRWREWLSTTGASLRWDPATKRYR
jgi:hypothetical protein